MHPLSSMTRARRGIQSRLKEAVSPSGRAFTLVEMLVVLVILTVLAVVSLPAITSLSKSSARQSAASLVISAFDQARGLALSQDGAVYLVFADKNMVLPDQNTITGQPYSYRSFAIFRETYSPTAQNYSRVPVTGWKTLPDGIAFKPDTINSDTIFCASSTETFYAQPLARDVVLPCFKFNSLGALEEPAETAFAQIKIFEGSVDANGVASEPVRATAAEEVITVSLVTGRAKRQTP